MTGQTLLPAVTLAIALALSPLGAEAQTPTTVRDVAVTADIDAIGNPRAATYWAGIADDLQGAILALVTDRIAEDGVKVAVDLSAVELANTFEDLADIADTRMSGRVTITSQTDNAKFNTYDLTVTIEQALPYFPPGTVISAVTIENRDFYTAMVNAFAHAVVDRL